MCVLINYVTYTNEYNYYCSLNVITHLHFKQFFVSKQFYIYLA